MYIYYAFCHISDEIIDSPVKTVEEKTEFIEVLRDYLNQLFDNRTNFGYLRWAEIDSNRSIDWTRLKQHLNNEELAVFKCLSRMVYYLPQEPLYELLNGFETDVNLRVIKDDTELHAYLNDISTSVGTVYLFICFHRGDGWTDFIKQNFDLFFATKSKPVGIVS